MKVLLVRPPEPQMSQFYNKGESLALGYLAGVLREHGVDVEILDCVLLDWDHARATREILERDFGVLGLTVLAVSLEGAADLARSLRDGGCSAHITVGGYYPTFRAREILAEHAVFDSAILFEGELTLLELVEAIRSQREWRSVHGLAWRDGESVRVNPLRAPILDLDSLPFPARDMLPYALRWERDAYACTSRGCWGQCTYCSVASFYRNAGAPPWRARSARNVVDEFEFLQCNFSPPAIGIVDADFVGSGHRGRRRALDIAGEIRQRGLALRLGIYARVDEVEYGLFQTLKEAGVTTVYLGIESGVQSALDRWRKGTTVEQNYRAIEVCARLGIHVEAGFMLYSPYTTMEEILQNLRFLDETKTFDFPSLLARMEVRAGMPMEDQLRKDGRLESSCRTPSYRMPDPRAECFHASICRVLEPLAGVYLRLRDLKRTPGVPSASVALAQDRLRLRALGLARALADAMGENSPESEPARDTSVELLRSQSEQEANRLWRVASFFEQTVDEPGVSGHAFSEARIWPK